MPGIMQELISITSPTMSERFSRSGVAASLTSVQMNVYETEATGSKLLVQGIPQPFGGSLVALSAVLSAAAGAGSLTLIATINGVATNLQLVITTLVTGYTVQEYGSANFQSGDRIGVQVTTSAGWTGTTSDLLLELYFVFVDARF